MAEYSVRKDWPLILGTSVGFFVVLVVIGTFSRLDWYYLLTFTGGYLVVDFTITSILTVKEHKAYTRFFTGQWQYTPPVLAYVVFAAAIILTAGIAEILSVSAVDFIDVLLPAPNTLVLWSFLASTILAIDLDRLYRG